MELEDSLYPLLRKVSLGTDPEVVFEASQGGAVFSHRPWC